MIMGYIGQNMESNYKILVNSNKIETYKNTQCKDKRCQWMI